MNQLKTREQVRKDFDLRGESIASWCREHGFTVPNTYQLLNGRNKGLRGECHHIAVALGMKRGAPTTRPARVRAAA